LTRVAEHNDSDPGGDEAKRRQRMRSIAIAVALALLVGLFYAATIVRLGGNVANRPL
jgi:hypothetical protein